ncbi:MAG: magnesium transporter [Planctomycetota bacterium]
MVREAVAAGDAARLDELLGALSPDAITHAVSRLSSDERDRLFELIDAEWAAYVVDLLPEDEALGVLESLDAGDAAQILQEFTTDEQADYLSEIENAEEILEAFDPEDARELRALVTYDEDSAGGLMGTEFLSFADTLTAAEVVAGIQEEVEENDFDVQYVFVVDAAEKLVGVVPLRDLLLSRRKRPITAVMQPSPHSLRAEATLDEVREFFDEHDLFGAPVVDAGGRLVGVVRRAAARDALAERSDADNLRRQGIVGGEELRSMPMLLRSRRRLAWLSLNILLNIAAASVIAAHQGTLEAVIALAVFLPIISDMSGCSGNQAVAVSMRELSLNVARPDDFFRVLGKEISVGLLNGLALGVLLGAVAWLWKGNPWLGAVVGGALMANTLIAVAIGGTIPLVLKKLKLDPALASGPILTTVTDMCGFLILLSAASATLDHLV